MNRRRLAIVIILLAGLLLIGSTFATLQAHRRQYRLDRQLVTALKAANISEALSLLNAGADPNTPLSPPPPPTLSTLWAYLRRRTSHSRNVMPTAFAIVCGSETAEFSGESWLSGMSPMRFVDSAPLVQSMIRHGAQIDARGFGGWTPLAWATKANHPLSVRALLDAGTRVDGKSAGGWTPTMYLSDSSIEVARLLLSYGANLKARADNGTTPLHAALPSGSPKLIQLLLEHGADVNARDNDGDTPLIKAIGSAPEVIRTLLDHGADVHVRSNEGDTALHAACEVETNPLSVIQMLVNHGADVNVADGIGQTPLLIAAGVSKPSVKVLRLLLAHGARVDAADADGNTPLAVASGNDFACVQSLLQHGAKVNTRNKAGVTPLMHTVAEPAIGADVVQILLAHGADPNFHAPGKPTALQIARSNLRPDLVKLLQRAGAKN